MASQSEIEAHYDVIGVLHALRVRKIHGGFPDYTCAFFNGDFSKSLQQAQHDKHSWIFDGLGLGQNLAGKRVFDVGCGWGPILNAVQQRGGSAVGVTLSQNQQRYCNRHGLDARLLDYKDTNPDELGEFSGVTSVGSMEAYCSIEELERGQQERIYREFFSFCAALLPPGGRLFVQTMVWGKRVPKPSELSLDAPADSEQAILARISKFYPGSWLPNGLDQIVTTAEPHFRYLESSNGRLDYIETLDRWGQSSKNLLRPSILPRTIRAAAAILARAAVDADTRTQLSSLYHNDQQECFRREIMSHERIFFEKRG